MTGVKKMYQVEVRPQSNFWPVSSVFGLWNVYRCVVAALLMLAVFSVLLLSSLGVQSTCLMFFSIYQHS